MRKSLCASARPGGVFLSVLGLLALVLATLAPSALARVGYVTNADSENVSAFDTQTNLVTGSPIAVGKLPDAIAITPDDATAYVANAQSDTVSAINVRTNQVVGPPIAVGSDPDAIAITPDGATAYVANRESHTVSVIETRTSHVVGSPIPVGEAPDAIAITPDGRTAYIANAESGTLSVIDTQTNQVVGSPIATPGFPRAIAITPDGTTAYVAEEASEGVAVVNLGSSHTVGTPIVVGKSPKAIAITPDGKTAYVANQISNDIAVIDTPTGHVVGSPIPTGGHTEAIAITPDGKTAYFTVEGKSAVSAIDTRTNQVVVPATIVAGASAFEIAITPDQPPLASFTAPRARPGVAATFNASASSDPDGTITSYAWSFGDGQAASGGPSFKHAYAKPGTYQATLTLTDNEGCSTSVIFTGQTAYCNGSASASQTQTITVSYPGVRLKCPKSAKPKGCAFKLQAVAGKPKKGKKGKAKKPKAESALARAEVKAGGSEIVLLKPKKSFAAKLAAAKQVLVEEVLRTRGSKRTFFKTLKIVQ